MAKQDSGLLIAALVAIVAVVGLVILFKGGSTGNAHVDVGTAPSYVAPGPAQGMDDYTWGQGLGEQIAGNCGEQATDQYQCCSRSCGSICSTSGTDCFQGCKRTCEYAVAGKASGHIY